MFFSFKEKKVQKSFSLKDLKVQKNMHDIIFGRYLLNLLSISGDTKQLGVLKIIYLLIC